MEQRARVMGKTAEAAVYRAYIEKMKKITKQKNETTGAVMAHTSWLCNTGDCVGTDVFKNRCVGRKDAYTV